MQAQLGWGRAQLEDGRVLPFDVTACAPHLPTVGVEAVVELGPSRLGREKISRLVPVAQWKPDHVSALFLRQCSDTEAELFVLDTLGKNPRCQRVKVASPRAVPALEPGRASPAPPSHRPPLRPRSRCGRAGAARRGG